MGRRMPLPPLQETPKRTPSKPIRKAHITTACDSCNVRKVRCGVVRPCAACKRLGFECTQSRLLRDKGPKRCREKTRRKVEELQAASGAQAAASQGRHNDQDYVELDSHQEQHKSDETNVSKNTFSTSAPQPQQAYLSQGAAQHSSMTIRSEDVRAQQLNPMPMRSTASKQHTASSDGSSKTQNSLVLMPPDDRFIAMAGLITTLQTQLISYHSLVRTCVR
jgi:hypothetical protein